MRTVTRSDASVMTPKPSPCGSISSAPASSTASITSSSVVLSPETTITPLRWKLYATLPGSAIVPPLRVIAVRTSAAARFCCR